MPPGRARLRIEFGVEQARGWAYHCGMVSDKGGKYGYVVKSRQDVYLALRRQGKSKKAAARIANAGATHAARSRMAKKAARTRRK
jgi:hypothetical protein